MTDVFDLLVSDITRSGSPSREITIIREHATAKGYRRNSIPNHLVSTLIASGVVPTNNSASATPDGPSSTSTTKS